MGWIDTPVENCNFGYLFLWGGYKVSGGCVYLLINFGLVAYLKKAFDVIGANDYWKTINGHIVNVLSNIARKTLARIFG